MTLRVTEVVIDCADHGALVDFWAAAMGYERREVNEQYVAWSRRRPPPSVARRCCSRRSRSPRSPRTASTSTCGATSWPTRWPGWPGSGRP